MDGLDTILKSEKCDCFKDVKPSGCSFAMKNGITFLCCNFIENCENKGKSI